MSTPWDKLRDKMPLPPIKPGVWRTSGASAEVRLHNMGREADIGIGDRELRFQSFRAGDLRELAQFCTELADQLEGK